MLLVAAGAAAALLGAWLFVDAPPLTAAAPHPLLVNAALAIIGYTATERMVLAMCPVFVKARLFGIDLNKPSTKRDKAGALIRPYDGPIVPEAMGAIGCTVYLVCMFAFIPFPFLHDYASWGADAGGAWGGGSGGGSDGGEGGRMYHFPHEHLTKFLVALLAICCMCFLGFADNVLDLRWRDRLWLPLAASLPLLMVYAVDGGGTVIVLPRLLVPLFGVGSLRIGGAYYLFMACLAIFCTNSINILAGVNGVMP